jgi:ABC-type branched-subunit amino acid transport system permease subunit
MGLAFVAAGAYPLALGLGLAAAPHGRLHAPLWVAALAGTCFVLVGALLLIPESNSRLRGFVGGVFVTAFASTFDWIAFGPGQRYFGTGFSFGGWWPHSGSNETSGRIVFGLAAVALDALALWGWYRWARGADEARRESKSSG